MRFFAVETRFARSGGCALAADTNAGTAGRPGAVLTADECVAAWHGSAGNEFDRFKVGELVPVTARGIVTNFVQADKQKGLFRWKK